VSDSELVPARTEHQSKPRTGRGVREFLERVLEDPKKRKNRRKPKFRDRGMPPLPTFDFDALADGTHLTEREVASVLRRSLSCLQNWRADPAHPLAWARVAGRVLYTAGNVRKFREQVTTWVEPQWPAPRPRITDIAGLPNNTLLSASETAAIIQRTKQCLSLWRNNPDHPLRWDLDNGHVRYSVGAIRKFLKGTK
jgi:hypothetical protein